MQELKLSYEDYCLLPEGDRRQLVAGNFLMTPAPSERHQRLCRELHLELGLFLRRVPLGELYSAPFDVVLDDNNVVQPDLLIVLDRHRERIHSEGVRGAPDLVVEVLSDSTRKRDEVLKTTSISSSAFRNTG